MDIGGTNSVFGIVDADGHILKTGSVKTQQYTVFEDYVNAICTALFPLILEVGGIDKIRGFGIGAPNGNYYKGTIEFAPNLPWKDVLPLARAFSERLGIPVAVTNDANAAAIGEMTYGAARGMKNYSKTRPRRCYRNVQCPDAPHAYHSGSPYCLSNLISGCCRLYGRPRCKGHHMLRQTLVWAM